MSPGFLPAQSDRVPQQPLRLAEVDESHDEIDLIFDGHPLAVLEIWPIESIDRLPITERPKGRLSRGGRFVAVMRPIDA